MAMAARWSGAHVGNATQRPKLPTSYGKRKGKSLGTHQSLQAADVTTEKRGEVALMVLMNSQIGGKWEKVERKRRKGKRWGRWGVPTLGGADGREGEARASSAGPIYRPARLVSQR
jgi:hypothetical protein